MSNPSSGGFGIGTIIFLVVMYNIIFDDDDEKVEVIEQDTVVQTTPAPEPDIKESLEKVKTDGVIFFKKLKKEALFIKDKTIENFDSKKEELLKKESPEKVTSPPIDEELKTVSPTTPLEIDQPNEKSNESNDTMIKL